MATGMPTIQDSSTDRKAICAVSGPRRRIMSATLSERKKERPNSPRRMSPIHRRYCTLQRVAQPELRHVAGALLVGQPGEAIRAEDRNQRIAGQHAHDDEDEDGNAEHGQRTQGQAP